MSDDVKPALTAEQWKELLFTDGDSQVELYNRGPMHVLRVRGLHGEYSLNHSVYTTPNAGHAVAALALHAQPYGFTWDDVDTLIGMAEWLEATMDVDPGQTVPRAERARDIATRITALLPPREAKP